jgi:uncharacterized protein
VKLSHAFEVPASPAATLALLVDAERVVPCMPGAELVETVDERTWKARMGVMLGPVTMEFLTDVRLVEVDEAAGRVRMQASGREARGKGGAQADISSTLQPAGQGTRVEMETDLRFSGQAAQLGRPSVVQDVSSRLVDQFAACLRARLTGPAGAGGGAAAGPQKPISGLSLFVAVLTGALRRLVGRGRHQPRGGSA